MTQPRRPRQARQATVLRTEQLTPHLIRVVLGGEGLAGFPAGEYTDHYVKILFLRDGVPYPEPFDLEKVRAEFPRESWPRVRTYTVRSWDAETGELAIDFVVHGDEGVAGPWAAAAQPGDVLLFQGPGGAYAPDEDADWHLLVGDEAALPAIAASLERVPAGRPAHVFVEVGGPDEELKLATDADARITWVHRGDRVVGEALVDAVRMLEWPSGAVHAFVHGEANFVKELRKLLRVEKDVPREQLSISGYWRRGRDEDGWQSTKGEWNAQVEQEEASAIASRG
ncbi:siderophore-interacting protein [Cryptosporangium phraense]|uniref:Siderophore-interacting protein n=1 Tax=Cryptosporangium phraense TaxID=2593070 RepID=A0A545AWH4_9ACTN|nr:siderophore-interacting protein [Cryptosporangium phraense]TQS45670.1 siderophore-interacting protein [Cryptosporangium phraense]